MKHFYKLMLTICLSVSFFITTTHAATSLVAGDMVVLGFNADDTYPNQRWSVATLVKLTVGTVVHFTDAGITESGGFFSNPNNEGHLTWTITTEVPAGTIFTMKDLDGNNDGIDFNGSLNGTGGLSDYGTITGNLGSITVGQTNGFTAVGDQIFIYQGTASTTLGATFIYGLNTGQNTLAYASNGAWQVSNAVTGQQQSYLPVGLVDGTSAVALTSGVSGVSSGTGSVGSPNYGFNNMVYQGALTGTKAQILAAIGNSSNWAGTGSSGAGTGIPFDFGVGTGFTFAANFSITAPPTLVSASFSDSNLIIGETATVTFVFSAAVTGFTTADLTVPNGLITGLGTSDGGVTWTGTFTPDLGVTAATNVITVNLGGVTSILGNLAGSGTADSENYQIDAQAPTVSSVTSPTGNAIYKTGNTINIQVNFSEVVNVNGSGNKPQLTLETGAIDRVVNYTSGSGTSTLSFSYVVQAGDVSADLDYISTSALALNGGTIKDVAGNNAILTLASPGATNSLGANKNIVIDTQAPSLTISSNMNALKIGDVATITFTFSEAPLGFTAADVVVIGGSPSGFAATANPLVYTMVFTPTANFTGNGSASVSDGTYTDAVSNPGIGDSFNMTIDTQAPTATISSSVGISGSGTTTSPIPFTITFSESVTGFAIGDITISNGTPNNFSGSGTTYTFNVAPTTFGNVTVSVAANVAADLAGNGNVATSSFTINYANVLPVSLISFTAKADGNSAHLEWKTQSEQNNNGFEIYRSGDALQFVKIGQVNGNGTTAAVSNYSYYDKQPLNGNNYYKLVQLDLDGKATELGERTLSFKLSALGVQLYPNPALTYATVTFDAAKYHTLTLLSIGGKVLQTVRLSRLQTQINLNIAQQTSGTYLVRLLGDNISETVKLIKQ